MGKGTLHVRWSSRDREKWSANAEAAKHEAARIHAAAKQLVPMRMVGATD